MLAERAAATRVEAASSVEERHSHILLAEDDHDISESVRVVLEDAGYRVETCRNGREALARLREDPFDLVVLDLMMPIMDGWEFRAQQRGDRSIADIPVVVISGDASAKAEAVHAESYVRKPFAPSELLAAIERALFERDRRNFASHLEETERLALLGTIAAGVGHEINNPLSFTMGNLELSHTALNALRHDLSELREMLPDPARIDALARIEEKLDKLGALVRDGRTGAERVRLIVRNLQSLGRRSEDRRVKLDLRRVVDSSISIAWNQIQSRAKLERTYSDGVDVAGDDTRLGQVFLNLLVNATQAIHELRPEHNTIAVTIRREPDFAVVEIRDSGTGMSRAQRARAFEPFFTTKGQGEGTGLGLSISRDIVNAHGGAIAVDSEPGRGSTFTVRLPLWRNDVDGVSAEPRSHRFAQYENDARKLVWIVDDDPLVAHAIDRMLARTYDVVVTGGPRDVVTRLRNGESFDALVCDLMMPDISGMELARLVASERPELTRRLIFVSGGVYTREAAAFASDPARIFVEKPFDERVLRRVIEHATAQ